MAEKKEVKNEGRVQVKLVRTGIALREDDIAKLKELGFDIQSTRVIPDIEPMADVICRTNC